MKKTFIAIDLKSFYASVECIDRGLDPLLYNLVVADEARTNKTICLAVSPALKSFGVSGRPRLFEAIREVKNLNINKLMKYKLSSFEKLSCNMSEINYNKNIGIDFIVAAPRMSHYIEVSTQIYKIYLKWIAPEDIHVYSIDEVFIDATSYLKLYNMMPEELASKIVLDVFNETGITATAGIGTNMYLCKVAMDILAKHTKANEHGVRIAILDEISYRKMLWNHMPITDFWRVGSGYSRRLSKMGLYTMGDVARFSIDNEDRLYEVFGVNAELLIDHAWGYENCTIEDIKKYQPENRSKSSGQVLAEPYQYEEARVVMREMAESLALDLFSRHICTDQIVITIGYDKINLEGEDVYYDGKVKLDGYGRKIPEKSHGTENLNRYTSSSRIIINAAMKLFDKIIDKNLYIRKLNIIANNIIRSDEVKINKKIEQFNIFDDFSSQIENSGKEENYLKREKNIQEVILKIREKYGKNSILKGFNYKKGATARDRNNQIGGHRS